MRIRDAVHGDINLDSFEEKIIRTKEMQRLHWVKQLGSSSHVYPCALHTRFDHSIGVSHLVKLIIDNINKKRGIIIPDEEKRFISRMALLHDIAHVSFGHMLETELDLVSNHDEKNRLERCLKTGQIGEVLRDEADDIINILTGKPDELQKPYQLEIIKDTISADLLDYLARDAHFTGIRRSYDNRILEYFNLAEYNGKLHLVIDITEDGAHCEDIESEMEHLLRFRYTMGARVYNYHTKIAADAMIGKAMGEIKKQEEFNLEDYLMEHGDESVIRYVSSDMHKNKLAQKLGEAFLERKLLRRSYMLNRRSFAGSISQFCSKFHDGPNTRERCKKAELEIIEACNKKGITINGEPLGEEHIIIFCHEADMNLKAAKALVKENDKAPEFLYNINSNMEDIMNDHRNLWRFYVFAPKEIWEDVGKVCHEKYHIENVLIKK